MMPVMRGTTHSRHHSNQGSGADDAHFDGMLSVLINQRFCSAYVAV